ncbi:MAG TPA: hypothetical protein VG410_13990 [Solirubrobacteraceae bacterium]|nr:hypothetical protein [Solirubrobacteraceae bacterium]
MTRFRGAAALLAAVVLTALVGAGLATAAPPRLSPTPPVSLPAHVGHPRHHTTVPHKHKPLPNTGLSLAPVLLAATALLALGYGTRIAVSQR